MLRQRVRQVSIGRIQPSKQAPRTQPKPSARLIPKVVEGTKQVGYGAVVILGGVLLVTALYVTGKDLLGSNDAWIVYNKAEQVLRSQLDQQDAPSVSQNSLLDWLPSALWRSSGSREPKRRVFRWIEAIGPPVSIFPGERGTHYSKTLAHAEETHGQGRRGMRVQFHVYGKRHGVVSVEAVLQRVKERSEGIVGYVDRIVNQDWDLNWVIKRMSLVDDDGREFTILDTTRRRWKTNKKNR